MTYIAYTRHAETRMQQRGIREADVIFILAEGTQVDDETWILLKRDAHRAIRDRRREIETAERLADTKVVLHDGKLVTAYASRPADQKRTLRRGRRKGLSMRRTARKPLARAGRHG